MTKLEARVAEIEKKMKLVGRVDDLEARVAELEWHSITKKNVFSSRPFSGMPCSGMPCYGGTSTEEPNFKTWGGGVINGMPWYIVPLEAKDAASKTEPPIAEPKPAASSPVLKSPTFTPPLTDR
jgi:hypothetical protein